MKRSVKFLAVAAAAMVVLAAFAAPAFARTGASGANATCAVCHSAKAKAGAPLADLRSPVDYTKCRTCHWLNSRTRSGLFYTHRHGVGSDCGTCHEGYSVRNSYTMAVRTAGGYFTSSNWASLGAADMHRIHAGGSWPQAAGTGTCASCHAPAACDACHAAPVTHAGHAYNASNRAAQYAPVVSLITRGTPANNANAITARALPQTCVNARCHVVSADASVVSRPVCTACHVPARAAALRTAPVAPVARVRAR